MNINSVGGSYGNLQPQTAQVAPRAPETTEVRNTGGDNGGDSDDGGAKAAQRPPAPIVNLSGQQVGRIISLAV